MIIPNGKISVIHKVVRGICPETGYPLTPTAVEYGEPIPCQYIATHYNALAKVSGEPVTSASYQVLIDTRPFDAPQIRLYDRNGIVVGDFSIQQIEPLDAVNQLRLWI